MSQGYYSAFGGYYKVQYYSYNVNDGWKWRDGTGSQLAPTL